MSNVLLRERKIHEKQTIVYYRILQKLSSIPRSLARLNTSKSPSGAFGISGATGISGRRATQSRGEHSTRPSDPQLHSMQFPVECGSTSPSRYSLPAIRVSCPPGHRILYFSLFRLLSINCLEMAFLCHDYKPKGVNVAEKHVPVFSFFLFFFEYRTDGFSTDFYPSRKMYKCMKMYKLNID